MQRSTSATARLLDVRDLTVCADIAGERRTIVSAVDFHLDAGETIGIVGESGSGKSLTVRALTGLLPRNVSAAGTVAYRGRELLGLGESELAAVRGGEISLLLQNPFTLLNPLLRCGAHIEEGLRVESGRLRRAQRREEAARRLAEVGIQDPDVARRYPFQLSGGMQQRVGLAAALAGDPMVLLADEPTTALDSTTQMEVVDLLKSLQRRRGMGLVLITHDLRLAFATCDRIYVLYAGTLVEVAAPADLDAEPLHPYSLGLLLSEPTIHQRYGTLQAIEGSVPRHDQVADQCAFAARCEWSASVCLERKPGLRVVSPGRATACARIDEIRDELSARRQRVRPHAEAAGARAATSAPLIQVSDVRKVFPGGVHALKGVSLHVERGECVGIVGESGSGKTTLARCLLGLETATSGAISLAGIDASDYARLSTADRRRLRRTVQIVFQDPYSSLNPARTIGATLEEACAVRGTAGAGVTELLERVGLPASYAQRKPAALSGGERQRVAVARALGVEPEILVLDEPVSALDVSVQAQILNLLTDLREQLGLTYVFITHDLAVVRQAVDRAYVFCRGEIVEDGAVEGILLRPQHPYTVKLLEAQLRLSERPGASNPDMAQITA